MLLPKLLLILLIHQQFLCHATWATRTNATAATTATTTPTPSPSAASAAAPLVSSSEATLLTTRGSPVVVAAQRQRQRPLYVDDAYEDDDDDGVATTGDSDHVNEIGTTSSAAAAKPTSAAEERVPLVPNVAAASSTKASAASAASPPMAKTAKSRYKITSVETSCTRDLFEMRIELNRGFRGLLYAKDFPFECRARGSSNTNITLRLPTSGCGVRSEPRPDGTMELSVRVMLQMEEKLRQSSDILRTVRCQLPLTAMGMTLMGGGGAAGVGKTRKTWRNGRMRSLGAASGDDSLWTSEEQTTTVPDPSAAEQSPTTTTATSAGSASSPSTSSPSTPRVRIWLELGGPDGSGAVEVGQATTLTVRAIVPGTMGVRVVDCAALDGLGDSTQQLLDERGCPIDEQVMPALHTRFKPAEEGWSKQDEDDLVEKTFAATFPAFKFPDRERLHVSCGVQLCKGKCPNINCRTAEKLILSPDKHLARIEVFNSLAVTAPQIEVDRLRYDRRYNMSVEEYPPNVRPIPSEGTLCLSVSKLALSFCVLGLIFLVAIVVAICSLIRSRRRAANGCGLTSTTRSLNRPEMCTSMFSSSSESAHSARFGSKLFIPYYPNTLPYGRVY